MIRCPLAGMSPRTGPSPYRPLHLVTQGRGINFLQDPEQRTVHPQEGRSEPRCLCGTTGGDGDGCPDHAAALARCRPMSLLITTETRSLTCLARTNPLRAEYRDSRRSVFYLMISATSAENTGNVEIAQAWNSTSASPHCWSYLSCLLPLAILTTHMPRRAPQRAE